jgi:AraC-like DNA-binding protein
LVTVTPHTNSVRDSGSSTAMARWHPNNGHLKFQCREAREAEGVIGTVFERRFDLQVFDPSAFNFSLDHFTCGPGVSVSRMLFGSEVAVRIGRVECFMVQMPLAGRNDLVLDGTAPLCLSNRMFSVVNPDRSLSQRRHAGCEMILVRFDRRPLAQCLAAHIGESDGAAIASEPIEFSAGMSTARPGGSAWVRLMSFVLGELPKNDSIFHSPLAASQAAHLIMSTLLLNQPHNYSKLLRKPAPEMAPRFIREARNWIDANSHLPITVGDIAHAMGLSTRSLYSGFRKYLSQTPMEYLKDTRLRRVRDELLSAREQKNVTAIAVEWGFTHLSNFAQDYRRKFGELPSQTKRGRGSS